MSLRWVFDALSPAGRRGRLSVLLFHRVRPHKDPLFPNEADVAEFEMRMRWIRDWFRVLPLEEALRRLRTGSLPARAAAITFDDGYADNCTFALPVLRALGLHATFFIATGYLDGGRMWNDTVIEAVRAAPGPALDLEDLQLGRHPIATVAERRAAIQHIIRCLKYYALDQRQRLADQIAARVGAPLPDDLMLTTTQLRVLAGAGMGIGAHTVSHPILANIPDEVAWQEITESKRHLESLLKRPVNLFAYPNGKPERDYTAAHVRMVREAGFDAALCTAWGAAHYGCDIYQIPRFTPWDRAPLAYALRLMRNLWRVEHVATA